ncbi:MAG: tautomerase family protein [Phycicoccus sp.]|nr:tautomerase family protein [Phycicoccus sp.]
MPSVLIEVRRSHTVAEETAMMDAVHESLVSAFRIPQEDRHVRLIEYLPHRLVRGTGEPRADHYTRVTIDCFAGRSIDAKRALYREIVARLATLGVPPEDVSILLRESPIENWGIRGGAAACDLDLGFIVEV